MLTIRSWTRGAETIPAIDGRQLHKALEIGRDFPTWITARTQSYSYAEGEDFTSYLADRGKGTPAKEFLLTLPMASELCLLERSDIGREIRRFILDQQAVQNEVVSAQICTDQKPMWELCLDELQQNTLKACTKCKTPFKGGGDLCQSCNHFDKVRDEKAALVNERNQLNVTANPWVECLIQREGGVTNTTVGPYGTVITFKPNREGKSVAKVENPLHRKQLLGSIFYHSYDNHDQEAAQPWQP